MRPRPMSVTIFGILNIGFALYGFCTVLGAQIMRHSSLSAGNPMVTSMQSDPSYVAWTKIGTSFALGGGVVLLAAGIGLLLAQNWARILSIVYAIIDMIYVVAGVVVGYPLMHTMIAQMPGVPPGLKGLIAAMALPALVIVTVFHLAYPVLLLIFMTRPKVIESFGPEEPAAPATG